MLFKLNLSAFLYLPFNSRADKITSTKVLIPSNSVRRVGGKRKLLITIVDNTKKIINESLMIKLLNLGKTKVQLGFLRMPTSNPFQA